MHIYPAIDLRNNQCVRLYKGQFDQVTTYADDPLAVAQHYEQLGAKWLHMVDLDAAQQNGHNHLATAQHLQQNTSLMIQFGGGIRTSGDITRLLNMGIPRVIIGSVAVNQPEMIKQWLTEFGAEHLVIAVDVFCQDNTVPMLATHGWQQTSGRSLWELLTEYQDNGLKHILCTDISRDGTLEGPNFELYKECLAKFPDYELQASGGVRELADLHQLKALDVPGVIIGKALYEKHIDLSQALQELTA